ncbi:hypothetical protein OK016_22010 [Vibrio chagasii]|nr:hypothetical protein [Vibrio chagasii]
MSTKMVQLVTQEMLLENATDQDGDELLQQVHWKLTIQMQAL